MILTRAASSGLTSVAIGDLECELVVLTPTGDLGGDFVGLPAATGDLGGDVAALASTGDLGGELVILIQPSVYDVWNLARTRKERCARTHSHRDGPVIFRTGHIVVETIGP